MASTKRVARGSKVRSAAQKAKMSKLYHQHHRAYFDELYANGGPADENERKYAGFRAWSDGYLAGLAARKLACTLRRRNPARR